MSAGSLLSIPASWRDDMGRPVALRAGELLTRRQFIGDLDHNIGLLRQLPGEAAILYTTSLYWFAIGLFALIACRKRVIIAANDRPAGLARLGDHAGLIVSDRDRLFAGLQQLIVPGRDVPDVAWPEMDMASPLSFFTSGSTGAPKRIDKQLRHLVAEADAISELFCTQQHFRSVCGTVPHHHAYGLAFRLIWPLLTGIPFSDETPDFLENALAELEEGAVFVTSPAHLHRLDGFAPLPPTKRPACVLSAGAPLDDGAAKQAQDLFGCPVTEIYGSTETGALACRRHDRSGQPWLTLPSVQFVQGSSGQATAKAPHLPGGAAELADEIRMREGGGFDLLGRRDRIAKIEGARVSLDEVEAQLHALDDVEEAFVILRGRPARLAACVVPSAVGAEFLANHGAFRFNRRIRAALAIHLEAASLPRHWCFVEQLPRGALGKISQRDVETLFDD
ncbi:AMP-binding protein [Bosea sp. BK604]|uniref:AMP-binding protein n=1 Tax=Bosea sp. BK604 TaxID=2512180 RepID=UPI0010E80082|nr:AMP-binding protein [Bosea sp. BK604]TCR64032.1 AMP-binding enzyme [Bosea sp. BK604]